MVSSNGKALLRYRDLTELNLGSRTKIWQMVKDGKFPPPVDDGSGSPAWLIRDIEEWIASRQHYEMKEPEQLRKWRKSKQNRQRHKDEKNRKNRGQIKTPARFSRIMRQG